jgi:hypothetical protein
MEGVGVTRDGAARRADEGGGPARDPRGRLSARSLKHKHGLEFNS